MKLKRKNSAWLGIAAALLFITGSAFAATNNKSVAKKPISLKDTLLLTYWGSVAGPSLNKPLDGITTNADALDGASNLYSSPQIGYKLNSNQAFYINPRFSTRFSTDIKENKFGSTAWYSPRVGFKDSKLWLSKSGNASLYGNIHFELPLWSNSDSLAVAPGFNNFLSVKFPGSRWSYGQWSTFRVYFYKKRPSKPQTTIHIDFYPEIDYKISKSVNFRFLTRLEYSLKDGHFFSLRGKGKSTVFLLQPGITWDIAKSLNINPYIQLQPKKGFSFESTAVGMEISGIMF